MSEYPFKCIHIIKWVDAYVTEDDFPEFKEPREHLTVSMGVKVKEDKEYLYLSHFYDGISGEFQGPYTVIPHGVIKDIRKVRVSTKKKK